MLNIRVQADDQVWSSGINLKRLDVKAIRTRNCGANRSMDPEFTRGLWNNGTESKVQSHLNTWDRIEVISWDKWEKQGRRSCQRKGEPKSSCCWGCELVSATTRQGEGPSGLEVLHSRCSQTPCPVQRQGNWNKTHKFYLWGPKQGKEEITKVQQYSSNWYLLNTILLDPHWKSHTYTLSLSLSM